MPRATSAGRCPPSVSVSIPIAGVGFEPVAIARSLVGRGPSTRRAGRRRSSFPPPRLRALRRWRRSPPRFPDSSHLLEKSSRHPQHRTCTTRRRGAAVGPPHEPGTRPVPRRGDHEAGPVRVLPRDRAGARPAPAQPAVHDEALALRSRAGTCTSRNRRRRGCPPGSRRAPTAPIHARASRDSSTSRSSTRWRRCSGWCR